MATAAEYTPIFDDRSKSLRQVPGKGCPKCWAKCPKWKQGDYRYECGGKYIRVDGHWVGKCPKVLKCELVGMNAGVPDGVLLDALKEAGLEEM